MGVTVVGTSSAHSAGAAVASLTIPAPSGTQADDLQIVILTVLAPGNINWFTVRGLGWIDFYGLGNGGFGGTGTTPGMWAFYRRSGPTGDVTIPVSTNGEMSAVRISIRSDSGRYGTGGRFSSSSTTSSIPVSKIPLGQTSSPSQSPNNDKLGAPGIAIASIHGRVTDTGSTLSVSGPQPAVVARAISTLAQTAALIHTGVTGIPAATVTTSVGNYRVVALWLNDPADVENTPFPEPASGEFLIAGPHGDPSVFATENFPGGIVEPGWPHGLRHGYAQIEDEGFLTDDDYNETRLSTVVPLDCVYSLGITIYDGHPTASLRAAILKRVDDTLVDVVRDFIIDSEVVDDSYPTLDACLLSFVDDVAYVAVIYDNDDLAFSHPLGWGMRAAVVKVDLTGTGPSLSTVAYSEGIEYGGETDGVHRVIALTDSTFVVAHQMYVDDPESLFDFTGAGDFDPFFQTFIGVTALRFDVESSTITKGPITSTSARFAGGDMCRVSDTRFVLTTMLDQRLPLKDRSFVPGTASFYRPGLVVRTCDVAEDLTITENLDGASVNAELRAGQFYGKATPFILQGRLVVAFPIQAAFTPQVEARRVDLFNFTYTPGIVTSVLEQYDTYGRFIQTTFPHYSSAPFASEPVPHNVGAKLFDIAGDGSVTAVAGPTHILDASAPKGKGYDYWTAELGGSHISTLIVTFDALDSLTSSVADDYALVSWTIWDGASNGQNARALHDISVGTIVRLDDSSPTGLHSSGYRHLGYYSLGGVGFGIQDVIRPRNLPGTDYFIGVPCSDTVYSIADGAIEGGAVPTGFPAGFAEEDDFGFYNWNFHNAVMFNDWDYYNMADLAEYGLYPGYDDPGYSPFPYEPNRHDYDMTQMPLFTVWDMTHNRATGTSRPSETEIRILDGKSIP